MGLVPKAAMKVDVGIPEARHEVFMFLTPEEALRLKKAEADVDAGKIDLLELYRAAAPVFKAEQAAADRPGLPMPGSR